MEMEYENYYSYCISFFSQDIYGVGGISSKYVSLSGRYYGLDFQKKETLEKITIGLYIFPWASRTHICFFSKNRFYWSKF